MSERQLTKAVQEPGELKEDPFFRDWESANSKARVAPVSAGQVLRLSGAESVEISNDGKTAVKKLAGSFVESTGVVNQNGENTEVSFKNGDALTVSSDGTITYKKPAQQLLPEMTVPAETTIKYTSGLTETQGGGLGGYIELPDGTNLSKGDSGWFCMKTGEKLQLTALPNGDRQFKTEDGHSTYVLKRNGEVQINDLSGTKVWAPTGSVFEKGNVLPEIVRDHFAKTERGDVYNSPDHQFSVSRTKDSLTIKNSQGTRTFFENGDLSVIGSDGQVHRYKASDAQATTYGGGYDKELVYPDGTTVTKFGANPQETYMSVPSGNGMRNGVYEERGSDDIVIQPVIRYHLGPNFNYLQNRF
jgi:hypothetical protein